VGGTGVAMGVAEMEISNSDAMICTNQAGQKCSSSVVVVGKRSECCLAVHDEASIQVLVWSRLALEY